MKNLWDINNVKRLLAQNGLTLSKTLGQNFLTDPEVCPRMAKLSGAREEAGVLEIGPGIGVLTRELAKTAGKVVTVELDRRLLSLLSDTLGDLDNVTVIQGDVLKLDLPELIRENFPPEMPVLVCANLPYYITSPVIMLLLESKLPFESITVMVQKEAAQRLCARVGSRQAGAVTVAVDYYARAEQLFDVPRESFLPSPKVDSSVMQLTVRQTPPIEVADEAGFFRMVKAAFSQRRKTAANGISAGTGLPKERIAAAIETAGFAADVRAETLTIEELARLYNSIAETGD